MTKISRNVKQLKQPLDDIVNIPGVKCDFRKPADIATAALYCFRYRLFAVPK